MTRPIVMVDLLFYTGTKGGMETYAREVYSRIHAADPDVEFVGYASRELAAAGAPWFPGRIVDSGISGESRIAWAVGEIFAVRRAAKRLGAALIHVPANFGPTGYGVPTVVTIHDLLAFRFPEYLPGAYGAALRWLIRRTARSARHVLTVSEASAADIRSFLRVHRVRTIPLAASPGHTPAAHRDGQRLLAVGNRMPHKGFELLLEALASMPSTSRPQLTITGSHGHDPLAPLVETLGLRDSVTLKGWLTNDELATAYATATAFVFPTRFEGFGLPVLEAMAAGCPVICADLPVLREVAGDAAYYCDASSAAGLAEAIMRVINDAALLRRLEDAGHVQAARFSWERTATDTRAAVVDALAAAA
ncbi:MAG TPA: glycosyltransferase family 1 protein [Candidatus Lumbricidophila sp.]|nr:glycosyltransferase family 1 protein [Candidatus Lumbricidophila sp.]